ncbi:MAG: DUF1848 domain-containing protein [Chitinispirillaceae bacterium]|nr:DUF1848 domain-containing protein [Chitinispirillaceae bacterium]
MSWKKTTISIDSGEQVQAIAPVIISASRSTDIPAFYGEWFMRRLETGYARWVNPWSGKPVYVSFSRARVFVFWSKNPAPFFPFLEQLDRIGIHYFFHVTLNDYEAEGLERGLPPVKERIETFVSLSRRIGRDRMIWRFDPLLLTDTLGGDELVGRIGRIGEKIAASADRLTISFIAMYAKVERNLRNTGACLRTWDDESRERACAGIAALCRSWNLRAVSCAIPEDLDRFGIAHGKCIDGDYILRIAGTDERVREYLVENGHRKDRGQRPFCRCIPSKDIGCYSTCGHGCVYCYANTDPAIAADNLRRHSPMRDSLCGYSSVSSSPPAAGSSLS